MSTIEYIRRVADEPASPPWERDVRIAIKRLLKVAEAAKAYRDMATSRYDSSRVAEFERKQDALGEALAELEAQ